jgi:hypothetical protein
VRCRFLFTAIAATALLSCICLWSTPGHAQSSPSGPTQNTPLSSSSPPPCDPTVIIGGPCKTVGQTEMDCKGQNILACLYPPGQSSGQVWYIAGTDSIPDCMSSHQILQFNGSTFTCIAPFPTCPAGQVFYFDGTTLKCGTGAPTPPPPTCTGGTVLTGRPGSYQCVTPPPPPPTPTPCDCSADPMCNATTTYTYQAYPTGQTGVILTQETLDCFGNVVATGNPDNFCSYTYQAPVIQTCIAGQMVNSCDANGQNCQMIPCPVSSQ